MTTPVEFTQWNFLTTPLDELCELLDARLSGIGGMSDGFKAGVWRHGGRMFVVLSEDGNQLECETAARAALARWFDIDITDWPKGFCFHDSHDGITWETHDMRQGPTAEPTPGGAR